MKTVLLFTVIFISNLLAQRYDYTFSELKGMEDFDQKTHLFYRLYTFEEGGGYLGDYYENSIYHFDVGNDVDTLFLFEGGRIGDGITRIIDLEFWNNNPAEFIYLGESISVDPVAFVQRYDQASPSYSMLGEAYGLELGKQNSDIVIASAPDLIKSTDAGFNWSPFLDSSYLKILSISPYSDDEMFFTDGLDLFKTTGGEQTISVVDTNHPGKQFFYDADSVHIYSLGNNDLMISDNRGNPFTWSNRYSSSDRIYISPDYSQTGKLYLADGRKIYVSEDYGLTFNEYKILDRDIVGIYKRPNSNELYAATKYKIYVITNSITFVIKSLPLPEETFGWFPLNEGDKWIYNDTFYGDGDSLKWISTYEVVGSKIIENQIYAEVFVESFGQDRLTLQGSDFEYFRIDSSDGYIYRADVNNDTVLNEELYMDLLAEVGDTIPIGNGIYLESEEPFTQFGVSSTKRTFISILTPFQQIELVNGFGLVYDLTCELVEVNKKLKGCIIDGVVYGDTTVVSVEDEIPNTPKEFSLSQNYPNPFNPSTTIKYHISQNSFVVLKVFDVLGNEISTLVNEVKTPGEYEVEFNGKGLSSGIYFYKIEAGNFVQVNKMILIK